MPLRRIFWKCSGALVALVTCFLPQFLMNIRQLSGSFYVPRLMFWMRIGAAVLGTQCLGTSGIMRLIRHTVFHIFLRLSVAGKRESETPSC
ncbi:hypothetical protein F5Y01DRAFT_248258 [Xylaria sp. FL0043]|nr:hypothetical protein F5Y01DRAFT_248258 [Xylaria sp. FL0043]